MLNFTDFVFIMNKTKLIWNSIDYKGNSVFIIALKSKKKILLQSAGLSFNTWYLRKIYVLKTHV